MNKTAMQELIDFIHGNIIDIQMLEEKATELLDKEKEQIRDAFNQGYREGEEDGKAGIYVGKKDVSEYNDSIYYYQKTYNHE